jgi:hypothetical protein
MILDELITSQIQEHLKNIGHEEPLPAFDESQSKRLLLDFLLSEFGDFDHIDPRETFIFYKALADLITARQRTEIAFHRKHMFD